jgi:hypothetical protein
MFYSQAKIGILLFQSTFIKQMKIIHSSADEAWTLEERLQYRSLTLLYDQQPNDQFLQMVYEDVFD